MSRSAMTETRLGKPPRGREVIRDTQVPGLFARGTRKGWVFSMRGPLLRDGRRSWKWLGPWAPSIGGRKLAPGLTLAEARSAGIGAFRSGVIPPVGPSGLAGDTVRAVAESYLAQTYPENEERREKVRALLELHCLPYVGGTDVRAVTRADLNALVRDTLKPPKGQDRDGGPSPAAMLVQILRALFEHAVELGKLTSEADSPAGLLKSRAFGIQTPEMGDRWLTAEEFATVCAHPEIDLPGLLAGKVRPARNGFRDSGVSAAVRAAVVLGPHFALRPSGLLGLTWAEVDFEGGTATIRKGRGAKLRFHERKRAKDFVVPLSSTAHALLTALRKAQEGKHAFVFPSDSGGGHLTGDVFADALDRLTKPRPKGARIPLPGGKFTPHDSRRTFAVAAMRLGVQELIIERCLQHSRGRVTDTYFVAGSELEVRREAHQRVDDYWATARGERRPGVVVGAIGAAAGRG